MKESETPCQLDQHLEMASKQVVAERSTVDLSKDQIVLVRVHSTATESMEDSTT